MGRPPGLASSRRSAARRCRHRHARWRSSSSTPQIRASVQPAFTASSIRSNRMVLAALSTRAGIGPLNPRPLSPQGRQLDRLLRDRGR